MGTLNCCIKGQEVKDSGNTNVANLLNDKKEKVKII